MRKRFDFVLVDKDCEVEGVFCEEKSFFLGLGRGDVFDFVFKGRRRLLLGRWRNNLFKGIILGKLRVYCVYIDFR